MSVVAANRIKELVDELGACRIIDLTHKEATLERVRELRAMLDEVGAFAAMIEGVFGHADSRRGSNRLRPPRRYSGRRGRRGPGEFPAREFILKALEKAGKTGLRNRDLVQQIQDARPEGHVRPSAVVSTTLTRLQAKGLAARRGERWYVGKANSRRQVA